MLEGPGYKHVAYLFDFVHAYGGDGAETAYFYDSPGDDTFVGKPDFSYVRGDGFFYRAKFFEEVHADASEDGTDQAELHDSALEDVLEAGEQTGQTWARLASDNTTYAFLYDLLAFDSVVAHAGPEDTTPLEPLPAWLVLDRR